MIEQRQIKGLLLLALLWMLRTTPLSAQDTAVLISPAFKEASIDELFRYITRNTSFKAVYSPSMIRNMPGITYRAQNVPLHKMLDTVLGTLGLGYSFRNDFIRVHRDERQLSRYNKVDTLQGRVINEQGEPLGGVSVFNPQADGYAITSHEGLFKIPFSPGNQRLVFSHIAYEKKTVNMKDAIPFSIVVLQPSVGSLQEVVVMPYHQVKRRNNTAAVDHITGEELKGGSPHLFRSLMGKVPGLLITELSGAPGAVTRMQIRGRQSIGVVPGIDALSLNDPLILLNKMPLVTGNKTISRLPSAAGDPQAGGISGGGISAQAAINPEDIETIDVLKDADATAIYGSRGAHGAILITTRAGKISRPSFRFNSQTGTVTSAYVPQLLDNKEYTAMRKEALKAAGLQPAVNNAPDLLRLDTNNYIDVPQLLAGGAGRQFNSHASLQGGDTLFRYYLGAGYYRETSVMPATLPQQRFTSHANIRVRTPGRRGQADLSLLYSTLRYKSLASDPLLYSGRVVPLLPSLRDDSGNLVWQHNGFPFMNPLGQFENSSNTRINTFAGSLQAAYRLAKGWSVRANLGYQWLPVKEELILRRAAGYPTGEIATANQQFRSVIAEPQVEYEHPGSNDWQWGGLLGATFQEEQKEWKTTERTGYADDDSIGLPGTEAATFENYYKAIYRYHAVYGRWHTDWRKRYFLNLTGRFDASSRFGPRRPMAFFGAVGSAWIFTEEKWFRSRGWLSYGKLRGSYGTAGSDNIDDYSYLETWTPLPNLMPYDSIVPLHPNRHPNPMLGWEKNRKLELALELEAFQSLFLSMAWYRNVTSDQLITAKVPDQAGPIGNLVVNWPAKVLNTGWELAVRTSWRWRARNSYTASLSLTLPQNRLLSFSGLASSAYNGYLIIGQSLSVQRGYPYSGVDPNTGLFIVPPTLDTIIAGHFEPKAYAGWQQEWKLGQWRIALFLEARVQQALNPLYYVYSAGSAPGRWSPTQQTNQPRTVLQSWHQPGDAALLQRFHAANTPAIRQVIDYFRQSSIMMADASFARIRSLYVSWDFPRSWLQRLRLGEGRIFLQGQNLFTITPYRDGDPTIQYPTKLSALRTITAGLQCSF